MTFSPEQLRLLLEHRQLKWSAFTSKKVIMIERTAFHGKVGKHLGRFALICVAQQQFVAIQYVRNLPERLSARVTDFVIDPKFPSRGASIKFLLHHTWEKWEPHIYEDLGMHKKIIRGYHETEE